MTSSYIKWLHIYMKPFIGILVSFLINAHLSWQAMYSHRLIRACCNIKPANRTQTQVNKVKFAHELMTHMFLGRHPENGHAQQCWPRKVLVAKEEGSSGTKV